MTERHTITAPNGKTYTIRIGTVGRTFGTCAEIVARNGRVVREVLLPYGFTGAAIDKAERIVRTDAQFATKEG